MAYARPPTPAGAVWIHQIHAAGGVGGYTTMVMVFVCVLSDSTRPTYI